MALVVGTVFACSVGIAPAGAADPCTVDDVTPHTIVVGLSTVKPRFDVIVGGCESVEAWYVDSDRLKVHVSSMNRTAAISPDRLKNSWAGDNTVVARVYPGGPESITENSVVRVKRRSVWSGVEAGFKADGSGVYLKGTLKRASWESGRYKGYAGRQVEIQFRAVGKEWTHYGYVTTGPTGRVSESPSQSQNGWWRLVFTGNSTSGGATSSEPLVHS